MLTDLSKFKFLGANVKIYELAKIVKPEVIEIGEGTQIDDFTFIYGGRGIVIGRYNHVCSFVSVIGGGELLTEDYVAMAAGCRIITGTNYYSEGKYMISVVPPEQQQVIRGKIVLKRNVFVGSNAIIYPNVIVGEGAIIGAGSLVTKDIAPWTINMGVPAHVVGARPPVLLD